MSAFQPGPGHVPGMGYQRRPDPAPGYQQPGSLDRVPRPHNGAALAAVLFGTVAVATALLLQDYPAVGSTASLLAVGLGVAGRRRARANGVGSRAAAWGVGLGAAGLAAGALTALIRVLV